MPSPESKFSSVADFSLPEIPIGEGPRPHPPRFLNPIDVDNYFRPLIKNPPSAAERWAWKADAEPFRGL